MNKEQYINLDLTVAGVKAAGTQDSIQKNIPASLRVKAIRFTEIANATDKNYELQVNDKTGIRMDYQHRLDLVGVIKGATFRNVPFDCNFHRFDAEGNQNIVIKYTLIDGLAGGESFTLRITLICEENS